HDNLPRLHAWASGHLSHAYNLRRRIAGAAVHQAGWLVGAGPAQGRRGSMRYPRDAGEAWGEAVTVRETCPLCRQSMSTDDDLVLSDSFRSVSRFGRMIILEEIKYNVLKFIRRQHKVGGCSRERLFAHIYGYDSEYDLNAVSVQVSNLRRALLPLDVEVSKPSGQYGNYFIVPREKGWGAVTHLEHGLYSPKTSTNYENERLVEQNRKLQAEVKALRRKLRVLATCA